MHARGWKDTGGKHSADAYERGYSRSTMLVLKIIRRATKIDNTTAGPPSNTVKLGHEKYNNKTQLQKAKQRCQTGPRVTDTGLIDLNSRNRGECALGR